MKDYHASHEVTWNYFGIDADPPGGKIQLLTFAGIAIFGDRNNVKGCVAWAPLVKRNQNKEFWLKLFPLNYPESKEALRKLGKMQHNSKAMFEFNESQALNTRRHFADHQGVPDHSGLAKLVTLVFKLYERYRDTKYTSVNPDDVDTALANCTDTFQRTTTCCGVPGKFCANDAYKGDLTALVKAYVNL